MKHHYIVASTSSVSTDKVCCLNRADHPFFAYDSYVRYDRLFDVEGATIDLLLTQQPWNRLTPSRVSDETLRRILSGAQSSIHTPPKYKRILPVPAAAPPATPGVAKG